MQELIDKLTAALLSRSWFAVNTFRSGYVCKWTLWWEQAENVAHSCMCQSVGKVVALTYKKFGRKLN